MYKNYIYIYTHTHIYIYILGHNKTCIVYPVKELGHSGGLGQLMGVVCNRTCNQALETSRKVITAVNS